jgi:hypothetical protein
MGQVDDLVLDSDQQGLDLGFFVLVGTLQHLFQNQFPLFRLG